MDEIMKIWIVNHYALPYDNAGGTRHANFAKQLIKDGHDVTIFAANYNHFSQSYIAMNTLPGEIDCRYHVPFIWVPTGSYRGNTLARFWNMLSFSMRLLQKKYTAHLSPPDVIIGSSPHLFAAFSAYLLAKRFNVPFLLEIRDIWPDSLADLSHLSKYNPLFYLMKKIELTLYREADHIISLLPGIKDYLIKSGVAEDKIAWLPNTIDPELYSIPTKHTAREKFTVMYAGAHGVANDLDTCLDAAKLLQQSTIGNQIQIILIGDGPEKKRLISRAINEEIHLIKLIDPVPKTLIYDKLSQADIFLMPLKHSAIYRFGISPNKLFDYLLMARPIIFAVNTPFNPIEINNAGITISPGNPHALAEAISQLFYTSEEARIQMGKRGHDYVCSHHHIQLMSRKLEAIISRIVTNAQPLMT
jgi:glycosyltransferase involved in cell wall biosynthesis